MNDIKLKALDAVKELFVNDITVPCPFVPFDGTALRLCICYEL
jgi:hypothetical protein